MWLSKKLVGVSGLFHRQVIVLQEDVILWLAFSGARPIFQEIEHVQFYRSFTLEVVNCNFHCTVAYYFLDGISLASTWCSLDDKEKHFKVEDTLQIMEFLNIDWENLVLQMYKRPDLTSSSISGFTNWSSLMNSRNLKFNRSLKLRTSLQGHQKAVILALMYVVALVCMPVDWVWKT